MDLYSHYPYQIATRGTKGEVTITTRIPGATIGAGPFFQRTTILHVMTNAIRVLEPGPVIVVYAYILTYPTKMVPRDKSSKTWMGTCLGLKFVAAVYQTHLSSSSGKMTRSVCLLVKRNVEKSGGRTCRLWVIKLVLYFDFSV